LEQTTRVAVAPASAGKASVVPQARALKVSKGQVERVRERLNVARAELQRGLLPEANLDGVLDTIRHLELLLHPVEAKDRVVPAAAEQRLGKGRSARAGKSLLG
jgi:hypothetical protein